MKREIIRLHTMTKQIAVLLMLIAGLCCCLAANAEINSGTLGTLTWTLSDAGLLEITGSGDIPNFSSDSTYAWRANAADIKTVTIDDGITGIGNYAFKSCYNMKEITIPTTVTRIGDYAFGSCSSLKEITIPDSVTEIGSGICYSCSALTDAHIGNGISVINSFAFGMCTHLVNISYPESITTIEGYAFAHCYALTEIPVTENTTIIRNSAFQNCSGLINIVIPQSVTIIGSSAFAECYNMTNIKLPDGLTVLGSSVFQNCRSLTEITIPDGPTIIYTSLFNGCTNLKEVWIPSSITSIDSNAFNNCTSLTDVYFTGSQSQWHAISGYNNIPRDCMLHYCAGTCGDYLTWTISSNGVLTISGTGSMDDYSADYDENLGSYCTTALWHDLPVQVQVENGVTSIGAYAFYGCRNLTSVTLPESMTHIGDNAFYDCQNLPSIIFPDNITDIGYSAFYNCQRLATITLPACLNQIGDHAFQNCSSLADIIIPVNLTSEFYNNTAFNSCSNLTSIEVQPGNSVYSSQDGILFDRDQTTLLLCPRGKSGSYSVRAGVNTIADSAFNNCRNLTEIILPESLTSIGSFAFAYCNHISEITVPENVTSIGEYAFSQSSLTNIHGLNGVTSINTNTFKNCDAVRYTDRESVGALTLGAAGYTFREPNGSFDLIVPTSGSFEIRMVDDTTSFIIPAWVTGISENAFDNCFLFCKVLAWKTATCFFLEKMVCCLITR